MNSRIHEIDLLRGLMLVILTMNHISGNPIRSVTYEPLGYFSAAEGFVFLSGLLAGIVYGNSGTSPALLRSKILIRIRLIFITWVIACSGLHLGLWAFGLPRGHKPYLLDLLFLPNPLGIREILGLYILLFPLLHPCLLMLKRGKAKQLLLISFALYLVAGVPNLYSHWHVVRQLPENPLLATFNLVAGYSGFWMNFSYFAWQFLFVLAVSIGYHSRNTGKFLDAARSKPFVASATILFIYQFAVRHGIIENGLWTGFASKPMLGPTRLAGFLCCAIVAYKLLSLRSKPTRMPLLESVGKSSLQVYALQLVAVPVLINPFMLRASSLAEKAVWIAVALGLLWLPPAIARLRKQSHGRIAGGPAPQ